MEADHFYSTLFEPLMTPSTTPPPEAAFITAALTAMGIPDPADPKKYCGWAAAFNAGRQAATIAVIDGKGITKADLRKALDCQRLSPRRKRQRLRAAMTASDQDKHYSLPIKRSANGKIHRRDLPDPPDGYHRLKSHPLAEQYWEEMEAHMQSHWKMGSFEKTATETAKAHRSRILDCMWVYTYKFDKSGYLVKVKARLVVRGDQQTKTNLENTYASTLAAKSFRTLMAIAARFDLELIQWDVVNAFVHADLPHNVFMKMPPGFTEHNTVMKLKKALYGLRESPLLWQRDLMATLSDAGFQPVPHEPCCWIRKGVIVFFYVDDIVVAHRKGKEKEANEAVDAIKQKYSLQGGGELQWFLGVAVIRDRSSKTIWLAQSDYIAKMERFLGPEKEGPEKEGPEKEGLEKEGPKKEGSRRKPRTPMGLAELLPYEGEALYYEINLYQRKIGTLLYAAVITRPDVAFAVSCLARFNLNPSPQHQAAADRVIEYLLATKDYALKLGGEDGMATWSDASFADNTLDRKSSQAYVMKLFGGAVAWKASKQDIVTTSTTEAELLALGQATKEAFYARRLINERKRHT
jgi:hypothetical protein